MEINSYPITLGEIFGLTESRKLKYDKFIIPGYQRPYEWTEEHIKTVFESIENGLNNAKNEPILFGTILLNQSKESVATYEIIDGQQRLTTFYLMLKALDTDIIFQPRNDINNKYEIDLAKATEPDHYAENKHYSDNFTFLKKYIADTLKETKNNTKETLLKFIVDRITFVVIETTGNTSIESTLRIFDSLNTTGLSLDVKDVFKIRFRDYLKKGEAESDEKLFEKINTAYNTVTGTYSEKSPYYISENDLIETFKLYLIGKERMDYPAENLKMSNQKYFEELFEKINENASIETFTAISKAIAKTQKFLEANDKKEISNNCTLPFAKELLDCSGYSKLKNIFYLFVYCQCKENDPQNSQIDNALKLTEIIWKFCSIYRTVTAKVINGVFNYIGKNIINRITDEKFEWDNNFLEETTELMKKAIDENTIDTRAIDFSETVSNNIFENSRKFLFMALSYIEDSDKTSAYDIKMTLFYREQWDIDIEHIASKALYSNEDPNLINSIGNLIYLERKINRSLGSETSNNTRKQDLSNKQKQYFEYSWRTDNKKGSRLNSVKSLNDVYSFKNWTDENIIDNLEKRRIRKLKFLKSVYSGFGVF